MHVPLSHLISYFDGFHAGILQCLGHVIHDFLSQHKHTYQITISVYIQARSYIYLWNLCLAKQPKLFSINTGTELQVSLMLPLLFLPVPSLD